MMGGVHTDINGATPVAGLYAAGEIACVSINGANRLGSNSLPELPGLRRPRRPGRSGVRRRGRPRSRERCLAQAPRRGRSAGSNGPARTGTAAERIADDPRPRCSRRIGGRAAGIYRTDGLAGQGRRTSSRELRERFAKAADLDDHSRTFNTELLAALELSSHARRRRRRIVHSAPEP